jgi:hypothetical protein
MRRARERLKLLYIHHTKSAGGRKLKKCGRLQFRRIYKNKVEGEAESMKGGDAEVVESSRVEVQRCSNIFLKSSVFSPFPPPVHLQSRYHPQRSFSAFREHSCCHQVATPQPHFKVERLEKAACQSTNDICEKNNTTTVEDVTGPQLKSGKQNSNAIIRMILITGIDKPSDPESPAVESKRWPKDRVSPTCP